jgi:sortase A
MNLPSRPTRAVSSRRTSVVLGACQFFLVLGIFALGYAGFVFADSHIYQAVEIEKFERVSLPSKPRVLVEGDVIGEIQVARLGLNAIVVQGDSPASLRRAVGHISKSPLPGEPGNVALAGHRDTFFRPLQGIRLGDQIEFKTPQRTFEYLVESIEIVAPNDVQVLEPSSGHDLTFITCFPFYFVGPAPKRFVVRAREVDLMPHK